MMKIKIRRMGKYTEVIIKAGNAVIDLGLLDKEEAKRLERTFEEAVDELSSGEDDTQ